MASKFSQILVLNLIYKLVFRLFHVIMLEAVAYGMRFFMSLSNHTECLIKFREMKHFFNHCSITGSVNLLTLTTFLFQISRISPRILIVICVNQKQNHSLNILTTMLIKVSVCDILYYLQNYYLLLIIFIDLQ